MSGPFFDPACLPQCASPRRGSIAGCYWLAPTTEDHDAISVAQRCELSNSSSLCRHGRTFPITNRSLTINVVQKPSSPYFNTSTLYGSQERKRKRPATPILPTTLFPDARAHHFPLPTATAAFSSGCGSAASKKGRPIALSHFRPRSPALGAAPTRKGFQTGLCAGWLPGGGSRLLLHLIREPVCQRCQPTT